MTKRPLTFVLAAGGTGGHMYPAGALAAELMKRGYKVILFADPRGMKFAHLFEGVESHLIESGTIFSKNPLTVIKGAFALLQGTVESIWRLLKISPAGVVGFGGYPVIPVTAAARFLNIPYFLHEQNAVLGRANRLMSGKAKAIALSFQKTGKVKLLARRKTRVTGNPVRPAIVRLGGKPYPALKRDYVIRLLVLGGSQGAKIFSDVVPEALSMLPKALRSRLQVTQQCREEDIDRVRDSYKKSEIAAEAFPYIDDVPERLQWSHLAISRAGATSIFEFTAAGRPAILVPLPQSMDDHQTANARVLEKAGAAWLVPEPKFSPAELAKLLQKLALKPEVLKDAAAAALSLGHPEAAERLADLIEDRALSRRAKARRKKPAPAKAAGRKLERVPA